MTTHFFDNWFAKTFLFPNYGAITLFGLSFYQRPKEKVSETSINHESIHQVQQVECMVLGGIISLILACFIGLTWWLLLPPLAFFYVWYLLETFIAYFFNMFNNTHAYYTLAFEMEAYDNDQNLNYLLERKRLWWFHYLGDVKYDDNNKKLR